MRIGLGTLGRRHPEVLWFCGAMFPAALAMAAFIRTSNLRWQSFETNAFDLAFFDQIIFNTSRGRWFETSFVSYNFAGQHLEPVLLAYLPAYWLGAGPYFLMVSQSVVAALAAIPLYFFARRLAGSPPFAWAAVVAYLANPYLHRALAFDFHPEVMATFPVFLAAWAIVAGRGRVAVAATLSVLAFKEDTVFLVLLLAGLMWSRGLKAEARVTGVLGVAYAVLAVLVIMPLLRGGESSDLVARYGYLLPSTSGIGVIVETLRAPLRAAQVALHPGQLWTAGLFLSVAAALAVRRPLSLIWLTPGIGLALLSNHEPQWRLELHYAVELVPAAVILSLLGAQALRQTVPGPLLGLGLAGPPVLAMLALNPLGAGHNERPTARHTEALHSALALIPAGEDVSVSAQSGLLPRLSQRRQAHEFPGYALKADWVVVDRYGFRSSQSLAAGFDDRLEEVRHTAELVFSADGVEVFRRID